MATCTCGNMRFTGVKVASIPRGFAHLHIQMNGEIDTYRATYQCVQVINADMAAATVIAEGVFDIKCKKCSDYLRLSVRGDTAILQVMGQTETENLPSLCQYLPLHVRPFMRYGEGHDAHPAIILHDHSHEEHCGEMFRDDGGLDDKLEVMPAVPSRIPQMIFV